MPNIILNRTVSGARTTLEWENVADTRLRVKDGNSTTPSFSFADANTSGIFGDTGSGEICGCSNGNVGFGISTDGKFNMRNSCFFYLRTTTERDALTPDEGEMIYNTTTKQPEYYNGTAWFGMKVT